LTNSTSFGRTGLEIVFTNVALRIDTVCKIVSLVVVPAIDHKVNRGSMTLNKLEEDRRALQDVDVVVGSRHTKGVSNPEIMGSHCLKYQVSQCSLFCDPCTFPARRTERTVLLFPMHAVNASKHPRKSSSFIESEDLMSWTVGDLK
jgi:hypothetical protein